jgi:hypothetical protein
VAVHPAEVVAEVVVAAGSHPTTPYRKGSGKRCCEMFSYAANADITVDGLEDEGSRYLLRLGGAN